MKPLYHTTSEEAETPLLAIGRWLLSLDQLLERLRPHFARPQPRHHARLYLQAILSEIHRKNGWQIAEYARQPGPYGMQRLLSRAVWGRWPKTDPLSPIQVLGGDRRFL